MRHRIGELQNTYMELGADSIPYEPNNTFSDSIKQDIDSCILHCQELFDIAWELNDSDETRTELTKKITTYMPDVMQMLGFFRPE